MRAVHTTEIKTQTDNARLIRCYYMAKLANILFGNCKDLNLNKVSKVSLSSLQAFWLGCPEIKGVIVVKF